MPIITPAAAEGYNYHLRQIVLGLDATFKAHGSFNSTYDISFTIPVAIGIGAARSLQATPFHTRLIQPVDWLAYSLAKGPIDGWVDSITEAMRLSIPVAHKQPTDYNGILRLGSSRLNLGSSNREQKVALLDFPKTYANALKYSWEQPPQPF